MIKILLLMSFLISGFYINSKRENVNTIMELSKEYRLKLQNQKSDTIGQAKIIPPQTQSFDQ